MAQKKPERPPTVWATNTTLWELGYTKMHRLLVTTKQLKAMAGRGEVMADRAALAYANEFDPALGNPLALGSGMLNVKAGAIVKLEVGTARISLGGLQIAGDGAIDVGAGGLMLAAGSYDLEAVRSLIHSARNGGTWTGPGITSSAVRTTAYRAIGHKVATDGSLIVGYAAFGDATMDGVVSISDLVAMNATRKYNAVGSTTGWWEGDFNFDGRFTVSDLIVMNSARLYRAGSYLPVNQSAGQLDATAISAQSFGASPDVGYVLNAESSQEADPNRARPPLTARASSADDPARRPVVDRHAWAAFGTQSTEEPVGSKKLRRWRAFGT